jgi:hypothetical protein
VEGATQPPALEFAGVSRWLNVDRPMSLHALRVAAEELGRVARVLPS